MIPKKTLIKTINKFFAEFDSICKDLDKYNAEDVSLGDITEEDKDKLMKYYNMTKAWAELDNSVERLTQFIEK